MTADDGHEHEFGPPVKYVAAAGRLEGTWWVEECVHCNAFSIASVEDPDGTFEHIVDAFGVEFDEGDS